ncbi:type II secretion system protein [Candidatus Peregrinibacteria bacterium]|nr:type II secretion system protein [Candidatus Peregrinibacteria bacterium]
MRKQGFTLIEMLVVVAIIGVLSSVILTALGPSRDKAKDARIIQEINQIRALLESMNDGDYDAVPEIPASAIDNADLRVLVDDISRVGVAVTVHKYPSSRASRYIVYSSLNLKLGTTESPIVNYFCVDSTGRAGYTTNDLSSAQQCPI